MRKLREFDTFVFGRIVLGTKLSRNLIINKMVKNCICCFIVYEEGYLGLGLRGWQRSSRNEVVIVQTQQCVS